MAAAGGANESLGPILTTLQSHEGDANDKIVALTSLCDILSLANEEQLAGFKINEYCRVLVQLIGPHYADMPQITLLATRAITNLIEALPGASSALIAVEDCIPELCMKLMNISDIEVAEQALYALNKMSRERPQNVLRGGGLLASLTFLAFFDVSVQRMALETVVLLAAKVPRDCFDMVLESLPLLIARFSSYDEKICASIIQFLVRVVKAFSNMPSHMEKMANASSPGVGTVMIVLVKALQSSLSDAALYSSATITSMLRILIYFCRSSSDLTCQLMTRTPDVPDFIPIMAQLALYGDQVKGDQLSSVLSLMNELLPDLSQEQRADRHRVPNAANMATAGAFPPGSGSGSSLSPAAATTLSPMANPISPASVDSPAAPADEEQPNNDLPPEEEASQPPDDAAAANGILAATSPASSAMMLASAAGMLSSSAPVSSSTSPSMSTGIASPFATQQTVGISSPVMLSSSSAMTTTTSPMSMPPLLAASAPAASSSSLSSSSSSSEAAGARTPPRATIAASGRITPPPSQFTIGTAPSSPLNPTRLVFSTPSIGGAASSMAEASSSSPAAAAAATTTTSPATSGTIPSLSSSSAAAAIATPSSTKVVVPSPAEVMRRAKAAFLAAHTDIHLLIGRHFVPVFLKACNNTANPNIRYKCLSGVLRILWATPSDMMSSFLPGSDLCSFISALLQTKDYPVMSSALQIAELLLAKQASQYHDQFIREGVVDVINEYCIATTYGVPTPTSVSSLHAPKPDLSKQMSPYLRPMVSETHAAVRNRARALLQAYFKDLAAEASPLKDAQNRSINALRAVGRQLVTSVRQRFPDQDGDLAALRQLHSLLLGGAASVTTHELLHSHIAAALVTYLSPTPIMRSSADTATPQQRSDRDSAIVALAQRRRNFIHVFFGLPHEERAPFTSSAHCPPLFSAPPTRHNSFTAPAETTVPTSSSSSSSSSSTTTTIPSLSSSSTTANGLTLLASPAPPGSSSSAIATATPATISDSSMMIGVAASVSSLSSTPPLNAAAAASGQPRRNAGEQRRELLIAKLLTALESVEDFNPLLNDVAPPQSSKDPKYHAFTLMAQPLRLTLIHAPRPNQLSLWAPEPDEPVVKPVEPVTEETASARGKKGGKKPAAAKKQPPPPPVRPKVVTDRKQFESRTVSVDPLASLSSLESYILSKDPSVHEVIAPYHVMLRDAAANAVPGSAATTTPTTTAAAAASSSSSNASTGASAAMQRAVQRALEASRPIQLAFEINGHVLTGVADGDMTIIELLQRYHQHGIVARSNDGARLDAAATHYMWEQSHDIRFYRAPDNIPTINTTAATSATAASAAAAASSSSAATTLVVKPATPLSSTAAVASSTIGASTVKLEAMKDDDFISRLPDTDHADDDASLYGNYTIAALKSKHQRLIAPLLLLLRRIHKLTRSWHLLYSAVPSTTVTSPAALLEDLPAPFPDRNRALLAANSFISKRLSKKLQAQAEDPIACCSRSWPSWCDWLCSHASFLFAIDTRELFFRATAFGAARGLFAVWEHLHPKDEQKNDEEKRGGRPQDQRERDNLPAARIQQIKIRLRRHNVLESSCDLFQVHGSKRGAVRAEFLGEEGVGLGPTLEYFTLVSHSIQRRDLRLWRDDNDDMTTAMGDDDIISNGTTVDGHHGAHGGAPVTRPSSSHHVTATAAQQQQQKLLAFPDTHTQPHSRLGSPPKIDPTLPPDIDPTRAAQFHRIGVMRCRKCRVLKIPHCTKHGQLLSRRHHDGSWACNGAHGVHTTHGVTSGVAATTATATISTRAGRKRKDIKSPVKIAATTTPVMNDSKQHGDENKPSVPDQPKRHKGDDTTAAATSSGQRWTRRSSKAPPVDDNTDAPDEHSTPQRPRTRSKKDATTDEPDNESAPVVHERKAARRGSRSETNAALTAAAQAAENAPAPASRTRSRTAAATAASSSKKGSRCTPIFACLSNSKKGKGKRKKDDSPRLDDHDSHDEQELPVMAHGHGSSAPAVVAAAAASSAPIATVTKGGAAGRRSSRSTSRSARKKKKGDATNELSPSRSQSTSSLYSEPCSFSTHDVDKMCDCCGGERDTHEWTFSKDEASYLSRTFPVGTLVHPHIILQCRSCHVVNFPGSEEKLTSDVGGQIVSQSDRIISEMEYRRGTKHLSSSCEGTALEMVQVLFPASDHKLLHQLANATPTIMDSMTLVPSPTSIFPTTGGITPFERSPMTGMRSSLGLGENDSDALLLGSPTKSANHGGHGTSFGTPAAPATTAAATSSSSAAANRRSMASSASASRGALRPASGAPHSAQSDDEDHDHESRPIPAPTHKRNVTPPPGTLIAPVTAGLSTSAPGLQTVSAVTGLIGSASMSSLLPPSTAPNAATTGVNSNSLMPPGTASALPTTPLSVSDFETSGLFTPQPRDDDHTRAPLVSGNGGTSSAATATTTAVASSAATTASTNADSLPTLDTSSHTGMDTTDDHDSKAPARPTPVAIPVSPSMSRSGSGQPVGGEHKGERENKRGGSAAVRLMPLKPHAHGASTSQLLEVPHASTTHPTSPGSTKVGGWVSHDTAATTNGSSPKSANSSPVAPNATNNTAASSSTKRSFMQRMFGRSPTVQQSPTVATSSNNAPPPQGVSSPSAAGAASRNSGTRDDGKAKSVAHTPTAALSPAHTRPNTGGLLGSLFSGSLFGGGSHPQTPTNGGGGAFGAGTTPIGGRMRQPEFVDGVLTGLVSAAPADVETPDERDEYLRLVAASGGGAAAGNGGDSKLPAVTAKEREIEYVTCPSGLYPLPVPQADDGIPSSLLKIKPYTERCTAEYFEFVGRLMAQCLMERRLLDVPFARPFFAQMVRRAKQLDELAATRRNRRHKQHATSSPSLNPIIMGDSKRGGDAPPTASKPEQHEEDHDDGDSDISDDEEDGEDSIVPWDMLYVHPNMGKTTIALMDICQRKRTILAAKARVLIARELESLAARQRDDIAALHAEKDKAIAAAATTNDDTNGMEVGEDSWEEDGAITNASAARVGSASGNRETKRVMGVGAHQEEDSKRERKYSDPLLTTVIETSVATALTHTTHGDDDDEEDDQLAPLPSSLGGGVGSVRAKQQSKAASRARSRMHGNEWAQRLEELQTTPIKLNEARELEILSSVTLSDDDRQLLTMDGCALEDLGLDFSVPGFEHAELKHGGTGVLVTLDNVDEYVYLLSRFFLRSSVRAQFDAITSGFSDLCRVPSLSYFQPYELEELVCGGDSAMAAWDFSPDTLRKYTKCRQGYTHSSRAVQFLFTILSSFNPSEQRQFVRFVTGSPRLPAGQLKSLTPRLSIIRIPCVYPSHSKELAVLEILPSVMTCTNYLKLPDYPVMEVMKDKLMLAMMECSTGFQLS